MFRHSEDRNVIRNISQNIIQITKQMFDHTANMTFNTSSIRHIFQSYYQHIIQSYSQPINNSTHHYVILSIVQHLNVSTYQLSGWNCRGLPTDFRSLPTLLNHKGQRCCFIGTGIVPRREPRLYSTSNIFPLIR